jgi:hypothetical protein
VSKAGFVIGHVLLMLHSKDRQSKSYLLVAVLLKRTTGSLQPTAPVPRLHALIFLTVRIVTVYLVR